MDSPVVAPAAPRPPESIVQQSSIVQQPSVVYDAYARRRSASAVGYLRILREVRGRVPDRFRRAHSRTRWGPCRSGRPRTPRRLTRYSRGHAGPARRSLEAASATTRCLVTDCPRSRRARPKAHSQVVFRSGIRDPGRAAGDRFCGSAAGSPTDGYRSDQLADGSSGSADRKVVPVSVGNGERRRDVDGHDSHSVIPSSNRRSSNATYHESRPGVGRLSASASRDRSAARASDCGRHSS